MQQPKCLRLLWWLSDKDPSANEEDMGSILDPRSLMPWGQLS